MSLVYNNKYAIVGSTVTPDPSLVRYWADLSEEGNGGVLKYWNGSEWTTINGTSETAADLSDLEDAVATNTTNISTNASSIESIESTIETITEKLDTIDEGANAYELPVATEDTLGGITVGYTTNTPYCAVQLDGTDAYVEIPGAEDLYAYGVSWETGTLSPTLTRVGNSDLHKTLPIQSAMKGCTLADDGTVNHYFNDDWTANEDGTDIVKDGTDGQVMIEIPAFYMKATSGDGTDCIMISEYALPGYSYVKKQYISAYEATTDKSDSTSIKLASVVNTAEEYRGGNNNSNYDDAFNTQLGMPRTNATRANFRTWARNRNGDYNWNMYDWIAHNTIYTLFTIEYATFNCQLSVQDLTDDGLHQGGLGNGVTAFNSTTWSTYWFYYPIVPCGTSDELGNGTGEVAYDVVTEYTDDNDETVTTTTTVYVPRYRGIENPFGHIWKNTDGVIFDIYTDDDGGQSAIYLNSNQETYADSIGDDYEYLGELPRANGYVSDMFIGTFFPSEASGASSTTGRCDYFYTSITSSSLRTCYVGGDAYHGTAAGLGSVSSAYAVSDSLADRGSRLVWRSVD